MKVLDILRDSILSIFDLYRQKGRSFFGFSLNFAIWTAVFTFLLATFICFLGDTIYDYRKLKGDDFFSNLLFEPYMSVHFFNLSKSFALISFGIYAFYLFLNLNTPDFKPGINHLVKTCPNSLWSAAGIVLAAFSAFYLLTFKDLFDVRYDESGIFDVNEIFGYSKRIDKENQFYEWINSVIWLLKYYLPYLAATILFLMASGEDFSLKMLIRYKNAFLTILILAFCIEAITDVLVNDIDFYFVSLIKIPFSEYIAFSIFGMFIKILVSAYFFLAFAAMILFPVIHVKNHIETKDIKP